MGIGDNYKDGNLKQGEPIQLCAEQGYASEASRSQLVLPERPANPEEFADFLRKWADRAQSNQVPKAGNTPSSTPRDPDISNEPR